MALRLNCYVSDYQLYALCPQHSRIEAEPCKVICEFLYFTPVRAGCSGRSGRSLAFSRAGRPCEGMQDGLAALAGDCRNVRAGVRAAAAMVQMGNLRQVLARQACYQTC